MQSRPLGLSGIQVAPLALGGNVFGWTIDAAQSFAVLDSFVDHGFNLIDTANMYSAFAPGNVGGESETIIGNWFRRSGKRSRVVLATKVGHLMGDGTRGLRKDYILKAVEDSLKRLKTDVIDLYQSHKDDLETPITETLEAYQTLIQQGKVRAIGASNFTAERLRESLSISEAQKLPVYATLQPEYNLYTREVFEKTLEPLCLEKNIGVINFYGLASGFLTGKYRTAEDAGKSPRGENIVKKYLNPRGLKILEILDELSLELQSTPAAISLSWLMHRSSVTAPIASATSPEQMIQIAKSLTVELDRSAMQRLNHASSY
ncbi:MAG: aldo/keto reductase [Proteobacteria bacterium]|nr:MAG: aldo/keto reductase [Pseudomonadota bacterium]